MKFTQRKYKELGVDLIIMDHIAGTKSGSRLGCGYFVKATGIHLDNIKIGFHFLPQDECQKLSI